MNLFLKFKSNFLSTILFLFGKNQLHQISKFNQIYNIWSNVHLDNLNGDYIEFGIFKGKSLLHSYKSYKNIFDHVNISFHGLDSFTGFPVENHNFYRNDNFVSNSAKVKKFFDKYKQIHIHEGFFNEAFNNPKLQNTNFSFAFIDCDIYESSNDAFLFLKTRMVNGGFIMIDDFTSVDTNGNTIAKSFFEHFEIGKDVVLYSTYSNGQVFRCLKNLY